MISPARNDAFAMGDQTPDARVSTYADRLREAQLQRERDNTLQVLLSHISCPTPVLSSARASMCMIHRLLPRCGVELGVQIPATLPLYAFCTLTASMPSLLRSCRAGSAPLANLCALLQNIVNQKQQAEEEGQALDAGKPTKASGVAPPVSQPVGEKRRNRWDQSGAAECVVSSASWTA